MIKILTIGDIVGQRSVAYMQKKLWPLRNNLGADLVVCNGENATEIHGINAHDARALLDSGVDLLTLGNHAFGQRDIYPFLDDHPSDIIRPANYPSACPGMGYAVKRVSGCRILCINASGTAFLAELDNPFYVIEKILERERGNYDMALMDFHGEATSEKIAMGRYFDGKIHIIFGTHTHVVTADEQILPHGTGYITDIGMTGPDNGILGTDAEAVIYKMRTQMPSRFKVADGNIVGHGALFTMDEKQGYRCVKVERIVF